MKVILLRDVPKVGKKYDVKDIADGYVRNFLLPRRLAEIATPQRISELAVMQQKNQDMQERNDALLRDAIKALDDVTVTVIAKADERGHLFKKLRAADVIRVLNEKSALPLEENMLVLDGPITTVGTHRLTVSAAKTNATFTLAIEREG